MRAANFLDMADPDVQQLIDRITAARDFAHDRARTLFAQVDNPDPDGMPPFIASTRGQTNRIVAQVLNVILSLDPNDGDDYTPPWPPEGVQDQPPE